MNPTLTNAQNPLIAALWALALLAVCSTALRAQPSRTITRLDRNRKIAPQQLERKRMLEKMDKEKLCSRATAVTVQSDDLLKVPKHVGELAGVSIAKTPPALDFVVVPLDPRFFYQRSEDDQDSGLWTVWGQGTYYAGNGKLYGAVGNHVFYDSRLHIFEYCPTRKTIRTFRELNSAAGLPIDYGDGKIHGALDFCDGPNMNFCTYWCEYPEPKEEHYKLGYEGGRLMSFNVNTRRVKDFGVPLKRSSWQYHKMDTRRGLMFAVGSPLNEFMCYDVRNAKMLYGGQPPQGMRWYERCMIVDEDTHCAYSSNRAGDDTQVHLIKYDSSRNRFYKLNACVPHIKDAGEGNQIRAATLRKAKAGWFMCISRWGRIFKFYPHEDRVVDLGSCWPGDPSRLYTTSIAISPDDKYVYYMPAAHGGAQNLGAPIVQFNTRTGERKAMAFLFPYLHEKYGYICGGTFSLSMDETGGRLFIIMNGAFSEWKPDGGDVFGDPSVIVVHIPESERP